MAGLDLDESKRSALRGNDVDLAEGLAVIAADDPPAVPTQVFYAALLSGVAGLLFGKQLHFSIFPRKLIL